MFAGLATRDKDPRRSLHVDAGPDARARARARRSSPSWPARSTTTPCGPRSSSRCRPSGSSSATAGCRSSPSGTTCPTTSSAPTWPASSCAPAPACTSGSPARRSSPTACRVELEDADGHDDTMMDPQQRIWGFETNFGGLAELAIVKANQLMPKPAHLTWEEAACPGLVNSTAYRQLISQERRAHEARRPGAHLGRLGRPGLLRHPDGPRRRRHPDLRRLLARTRPTICRRDGRRADHRPHGRGLPVLEGRGHRPGPQGVAALRARRSASSPAGTTSTSSSSTPAARPSAPASTSRARAAPSSPARRRRATCTSTTTATCG